MQSLRVGGNYRGTTVVSVYSSLVCKLTVFYMCEIMLFFLGYFEQNMRTSEFDSSSDDEDTGDEQQAPLLVSW